MKRRRGSSYAFLFLVLLFLGLLFFVRYRFTFLSTPVEGSLAPLPSMTAGQLSAPGGPRFVALRREELRQRFPRMREENLLLLANQSHPLPTSFQPKLLPYNQTGMSLHPRAHAPLDELATAVEKETGSQFILLSTYRSRAEQASVYQQLPAYALEPGSSEHETGLALDLSLPGISGEAFGSTPAGLFVGDQAYRFGFVLRYPEEKTKITGIPWEPWHLRYLGQPHATILHEQDWVLEEYLDYLEQEPFIAYGDYIVTRQEGPHFLCPEGYRCTDISPDNLGKFILTFQKG